MTVVKIDARVAIGLLRAFNKKLGSSDLLNVVGDRLLFWMDENFQKRGTEVPWAPLRPNTVAGRRSGSSAPLQDTGKLRQSANKKVMKTQVKVGYSSRLASFHHFGSAGRVIRPVRARALRFITTAGPVVRQSVRWPGIPKRRLLPSDALAGKLAEAEIEAVLKKVVFRG